MHECVLVRDDAGSSTELYMCHANGCVFIGDLKQTVYHVVQNQFTVLEKPTNVDRNFKLGREKNPRKYT